MTTLQEIKEYLEKEYQNLKKSRTRARTLQGILTKKDNLNGALRDFESILKKYEHRLEITDWNRFTDDFLIVKSLVQKSLKILDESTVIQDRKNINKRRNSEHFIEVLEESIKSNVSLLNISGLRKTSISSESDIGEFIEPSLNLSKHVDEFLSSSTIASELLIEGASTSKTLDKTSFEDHLENLKNNFLHSSFCINRALNKIKMAYEFPIQTALQAIPEFRGSASELPGFIYQIQYYADQYQPNQPQDALIHVVLMKLKGPAADYFKRIRAQTWDEVKHNLEKEFGTNIKLEELFAKIETLEQGQNETFQSYKDRALTLKEHIDEYELAAPAVQGQAGCIQGQLQEGQNEGAGNQQIRNERETYAQRCLKIHFLGGLKNRNLLNLAKIHKSKSFEELVGYLQEECIDVEQIENIEKRLKNMHIAEGARSLPRPNYQNNRGYRQFQNNNQFQRDNNYRNQYRNYAPEGGYSNRFNRNNNNMQTYNPPQFNDNYRPTNNGYNRNERQSNNRRNFDRYEENYNDNYERPSQNSRNYDRRGDRFNRQEEHYNRHDRNYNGNSNRNERDNGQNRNRNNDERNNNRYMNQNNNYQNGNRRFEQNEERRWNNRNNNQQQKN